MSESEMVEDKVWIWTSDDKIFEDDRLTCLTIRWLRMKFKNELLEDNICSRVIFMSKKKW